MLQDAIEGIHELKSTMTKLQSLSEQLDPLESAYADVRFFDVDVEQTQQQYEELMSHLNGELDDENVLCDSTQMLNSELERLNVYVAASPSKEELEEVRQTFFSKHSLYKQPF